jgi:hypothetical protein
MAAGTAWPTKFPAPDRFLVRFNFFAGSSLVPPDSSRRAEEGSRMRLRQTAQALHCIAPIRSGGSVMRRKMRLLSVIVGFTAAAGFPAASADDIRPPGDYRHYFPDDGVR